MAGTRRRSRARRLVFVAPAAAALMAPALVAPNVLAATTTPGQQVTGQVVSVRSDATVQTTVRKRPRTRIVRVKKYQGYKYIYRIGPWIQGKLGTATFSKIVTYPKVVAKLGKPYRIRARSISYGAGPATWVATYTGRYAGKFYFTNLGGQTQLKHQLLTHANLTGKGWRTAKGVGPGTSAKRAKARYPKTRVTKSGRYRLVWQHSAARGRYSPIVDAKVRKGTVQNLRVFVNGAGI